jgi:hypothetical protein
MLHGVVQRQHAVCIAHGGCQRTRIDKNSNQFKGALRRYCHMKRSHSIFIFLSDELDRSISLERHISYRLSKRGRSNAWARNGYLWVVCSKSTDDFGYLKKYVTIIGRSWKLVQSGVVVIFRDINWIDIQFRFQSLKLPSACRNCDLKATFCLCEMLHTPVHQRLLIVRIPFRRDCSWQHC